jgi:hypothetical protein
MPGERGDIQPSMSQSLLLQIIEQLSGVDQRIGILQGQNQEIIREQLRGDIARKEIYEKVNKIPAIVAEVERLSPLVDAHEKKHNQAQGALSLGRVLLAGCGGLFGAAGALLVSWLTGHPPHL